ncbi:MULTISPECIES: hypothetical protein [Flavobacterium]|uniref:Transcriptional regulator, crp/fnr family protein n=1 Tax=Flavobacterium anhuiense TaxID=459526 RepID=A0A444VZ87_9FLAO|nr:MULTISPECIES: hypothetical protein [Flavobacterium]RYJ38883.1 Transcriptional regulator, crp/fnr family protein [Flavobacterium anhuiense]WDF66155.1 hypothetical protein PQ463_08305 [Flavobacterium sp. KACC 22763]
MPEKTQTNTDRWCILIPIFAPIEIPARTILLEEGSVSKTMFFIEKGCLRTCT